jgi:preprotein translocase subunit SecG
MPAWLKSALPIVQISLSVVLILLILMQSKGSGLSGVFGGEGNVYRTKRGAEKIIHVATIVVVILFFGVAFLNAYR